MIGMHSLVEKCEPDGRGERCGILHLVFYHCLLCQLSLKFGNFLLRFGNLLLNARDLVIQGFRLLF